MQAPDILRRLQLSETNYYATLGLDPDCTETHIRTAYRLLAKQFHPDVNPDSAAAHAQTRALNEAYEILSDPARRAAYDQALAGEKPKVKSRGGSLRNVAQEMLLRPDEFLRGAKLQVRVVDPSETASRESYELVVPPGTAPGSRLRVERTGGGIVTVKLKPQPGRTFKVRGSDLRCDLHISFERAQKGGVESLRGVLGNYLRVEIPSRIKAGDIVRVTGEGLPSARGGRGDLSVRVVYRPDVRITRSKS